jgi:hypothetical protein
VHFSCIGSPSSDFARWAVLSSTPDGQISERLGPRLRGGAPKITQNALHAKTNFTSQFNVIWVVQSAREK